MLITSFFSIYRRFGKNLNIPSQEYYGICIAVHIHSDPKKSSISPRFNKEYEY